MKDLIVTTSWYFPDEDKTVTVTYTIPNEYFERFAAGISELVELCKGKKRIS